MIGPVPAAFVVYPPLQDVVVANRHKRPNAIVFAGRLVRFKGGEDALRVLPHLGEHVFLEIYGDGPDRAALAALARQLGLESRVHFMGWVTGQALSQALASAACLLFPSRLFETFGMVGPEAIRQGCPVVAYDVGGVREWCHPHFGTVVPVGDIGAMASAVGYWLNRSLEIPAAEWDKEAEGLWGADRFAKEYHNVLEQTVALYSAQGRIA